jgi:AraC-like DNA-binding protein
MRKLAEKINLEPAIGYRVWKLDNARALDMPHAHSHADFELNFLTSGQMRYVFGGRIVTVTPGRIALFWGSIPHQSIETSGDCSGVWATFPLPLLLSWNLPKKLDERMLRGEFVFAGSSAAAAQADDFLLSRWPADYKQNDPEMRRTLLLEIETRIRRLAHESSAPHAAGPSKRPEPGLESALSFLHANYLNDFQVEDAARAAGWHPKYLMRRFKQTLNMSVGEYLMRLRISHAQWLLITTDTSMLDIAFASGYQSLAPFYQAFKKVAMGVTPLKFRKNARAG